MSESLNMYMEGWRKGDAAMILRSLADDFVYDDPAAGRMTRAEFTTHLEGLFGDGAEPSDAAADDGFESIVDVVRQEKDGEWTAWGWWKTGSEEGAGLLKAGPDGVRLEKLAYYTADPT